MSEKHTDAVLGVASAFGILAILPTWLICLFKVLEGRGLETFRLGTVITSQTALHATYQDILISNSLYMVVLLGGFLARYMHSRRRASLEEDLFRKYGKKPTFRDRRIAWRRKHFPRRKEKQDPNRRG